MRSAAQRALACSTACMSPTLLKNCIPVMVIVQVAVHLRAWAGGCLQCLAASPVPDSPHALSCERRMAQHLTPHSGELETRLAVMDRLKQLAQSGISFCLGLDLEPYGACCRLSGQRE